MSTNATEINEPLRIASLLHSVGKIRSGFSSKSKKNKSGNATNTDTSIGEYSSEFIREHTGNEDAARLVESLYGVGGENTNTSELPDGLEESFWTLKAAIRLSSETGVGIDNTSDTGRLKNIFASLGDDAPEQQETYPVRPLELERETVFSDNHDSDPSPQRYRELWDSLDEKISADTDYETIVNLLEKYTWCVPYGDDVPLYDYLRITAAISESLYRSDLSRDELHELAEAETEAQDYVESKTDVDTFSLVKGDISGIQKFLHRMRNPDESQDRLSKRMRGRSTQLWLLNEGLGRLFLQRLDLPITNLIWSGGGQFYALVPASDEASRRIEEFEQKVNEWLIERFDADLFFVTGEATASGSTNTGRFTDLFKKAASDTDSSKMKKASSVLSDLDSPILGDKDGDGDRYPPCPSCGGDNKTDTDRCRECQIQENIGRDLPRSRYLSLENSVVEEAQFSIDIDLPDGGLSWAFVDQPVNTDALYTMNSTEIPDYDEVDEAGFVFTGSKVPYGGEVDRVWSFVEQQNLSDSDPELTHVTKMDVDSLGEAISSGMEGGPARLAALSRTLELFFSGYINRVAENRAFLKYSGSPDSLDGVCEECRDKIDEIDEAGGLQEVGVEHQEHQDGVITTYYRPTRKYLRQQQEEGQSQEGENSVLKNDGGSSIGRDSSNPCIYNSMDLGLHDDCVDQVSPIYIGFSGGDDMFFVGSWDEAIEFGRCVRKEFDEYTAGELSLSAGYRLTHPKYPVGRAIEDAEEKLDEAKSFRYEGERKDAASLFGAVLGWESKSEGYPSMDYLLDYGQQLENLLENGDVSSSMLHNILKVREDMMRENNEAIRVHGDEPIGPNVSLGKKYEWRLKYMLVRNVEDDELLEYLEETVPELIPWINVPVSWASLSTRQGG